jgi:hypothetical protein
VQARQYRCMSDAADGQACARCGREVRVSRDSYGIFERMHYVCSHYEFERQSAASSAKKPAGFQGPPDRATAV